jgi:hypothetical protein
MLISGIANEINKPSTVTPMAAYKVINQGVFGEEMLPGALHIPVPKLFPEETPAESSASEP